MWANEENFTRYIIGEKKNNLKGNLYYMIVSKGRKAKTDRDTERCSLHTVPFHMCTQTLKQFPLGSESWNLGKWSIEHEDIEANG